MDGTSARAALGLSPSATRHEVKHSYRTLAMHAHPDRGGDGVWFDYLTRAYEYALDEPAPKPRPHPFLDQDALAPAMAWAPRKRVKAPQAVLHRSFAQELELALAR